jgi:hypothetical protein
VAEQASKRKDSKKGARRSRNPARLDPARRRRSAGKSDPEVGRTTPELGPLAEHTVCVLAETLARFSWLLDKNAHRLNAHEDRIAKAIRERLGTLVTSLFRITRLLTKARTDRDQKLFRRIISDARNDYWGLQNHHSDLRHLSVPSILPESITFINFAWGELRHADLPEATREALRHPPALCLSDSIQPSEHSCEDVSVVALSKIDHANGLAWPLLLHELGHSAIRDLEFASPETERRAWLIEIGCDLFGLRMSGPGYLAPFVVQAIMERSFFAATSKHPSPHTRTLFLLKAAEAWASDTPLVQQMKRLVDARASIELALPPSALDGIPVICHHCGMQFGSIQEFKKDDAQLDAFVEQFEKKLPFHQYSSERLQTAADIAKTLRSGVLAGSSHDASQARKAHRTFVRLSKSASDLQLEDAFRAAKQAACDRPNNIFDIVTAAWLEYFQQSPTRLLGTLSGPADEVAFRKAWTTFIEKVAADDELLRASIEMADFHRRMVQEGQDA